MSDDDCLFQRKKVKFGDYRPEQNWSGIEVDATPFIMYPLSSLAVRTKSIKVVTRHEEEGRGEPYIKYAQVLFRRYIIVNNEVHGPYAAMGSEHEDNGSARHREGDNATGWRTVLDLPTRQITGPDDGWGTHSTWFVEMLVKVVANTEGLGFDVEKYFGKGLFVGHPSQQDDVYANVWIKSPGIQRDNEYNTCKLWINYNFMRGLQASFTFEIKGFGYEPGDLDL